MTVAARILLCCLLCVQQLVQAQNIVPNGNLEDVNTCDEYHCPCSPSAWFSVKKSVPTGYYHLYPDPAASGHQYFNIIVATGSKYRHYWQTKLLCPMVPGEKYEVSIKVAALETGPNVHDIGFYFTNNFIFSGSDTLLQPANYVDFLDAKVSRLRNNWFLIKKQITATTDAQYLVIGNFSAEDNASIVYKRDKRNRMVVLLADDITVIPNRKIHLSQYKNLKDSLYAITTRHSGDTAHLKKAEQDAIAQDAPGDNIIHTPFPQIDTVQLSNILFGFDQYVLLHPDTIESFRSLLSNPSVRTIQVVGFTDDAGTAAYNKDLSEKRAAEIARLISTRFGIARNLIRAEGRGISAQYPDKGQNRRVDIYVYHRE